ncbi:TD and POZ domain-containing protein 3-like [Parasteatoda tepidariorum]|uniref:TD and POZ domain-containing protein 3-like n=1 Tax=Parasteatoda tepidariorum TaxID=114398 RepID=UPI0039BD7654
MDFVDEYYARQCEEYETLKMQELRKVKNSKISANNSNWFLNYKIPKHKFEELACGVYILVEPSELNFPYNIRFLCYPNGNSNENEGYVSFMFQELSSSFKNCILNFTFTLVDVEGNQRFPQSFAKEYGKFVVRTRSYKVQQHGLCRYMERKKLLLSDVFYSDMLHVKCEIHFYPKETPGELTKRPYEMSYSKTEENLGTLFITDAKHTLWTFLAENSSYFKKILITDGATKITPFYKEDYMALNVMAKSILQEEEPRFHHTIEAFALYKFADRVLMPDFKRHCSNYLGENMSADVASEVIVMADIYSDPLLKDMAIQCALENWQEVIATNNWKLLQERRPKLAEEIYDCKLGKEKKDDPDIKREASKIILNTSEKREQFQFYL